MKFRMTAFSILTAMMAAAIGCHHPAYKLPPAQQLMRPGPGVDGPGPGIMVPPGGEPMQQPIQQISYNEAMGGGHFGHGRHHRGAPMIAGEISAPFMGMPQRVPTSQLAFLGQDGMTVNWDISAPGRFDSEPLIVPGRQNFAQGAIYRLKLTNIPGRAGVELYPTLEVGAATPRTDAYLAHNAIPVEFTAVDLDQVTSGNFVTKVIYLPDPEFQELALAGAETLVSTRLDPGVDPIAEADRRGAIMAVLRLGNKDLEVPGGEAAFEGDVVPASHGVVSSAGLGNPLGMPAAAFQPGVAPPNVSGITTPQWGMPHVGTPIGLPGPPHIPLGGQATLQKHVMRNHTPTRIPPTRKDFQVHVKQHPGYSYPPPVSRVWIKEWSKGGAKNPNPAWNQREYVNDPNCQDCQ